MAYCIVMDYAVRCVKAAEPVEMLFGMWTWVGAGNYVLDVGPDPYTWRGKFRGENRPAQDLLGHVWWLIYSKWLSRGQNRYIADSDWGVLNECTLAPPGEYDWTSHCCDMFKCGRYRMPFAGMIQSALT